MRQNADASGLTSDRRMKMAAKPMAMPPPSSAAKEKTGKGLRADMPRRGTTRKCNASHLRVAQDVSVQQKSNLHRGLVGRLLPEAAFGKAMPAPYDQASEGRRTRRRLAFLRLALARGDAQRLAQ